MAQGLPRIGRVDDGSAAEPQGPGARRTDAASGRWRPEHLGRRPGSHGRRSGISARPDDPSANASPSCAFHRGTGRGPEPAGRRRKLPTRQHCPIARRMARFPANPATEPRQSVRKGRPLAVGLFLPRGKSGHSLPRLPSQSLVLTLMVARQRTTPGLAKAMRDDYPRLTANLTERGQAAVYAHSGDADHRFRQADRRFRAMPITVEERRSIGALSASSARSKRSASICTTSRPSRRPER